MTISNNSVNAINQAILKLEHEIKELKQRITALENKK